MSTRPEEKEAHDYAKSVGMGYDDKIEQAYLAGATAEAKKAVELRERLKAAEEALRDIEMAPRILSAYQIADKMAQLARNYFTRYPQAGRDP